MIRIRIEVHRRAERWGVTLCSVVVHGRIHTLHDLNQEYDSKQAAMDDMVRCAKAKLADESRAEADDLIMWDIR